MEIQTVWLGSRHITHMKSSMLTEIIDTIAVLNEQQELWNRHPIVMISHTGDPVEFVGQVFYDAEKPS